jgi:hypothetical protein
MDDLCGTSHDALDNIVFDGAHVKSHNVAPALKPEDFARFNEIELRSHPWINRKSEVGDQTREVDRKKAVGRKQ